MTGLMESGLESPVTGTEQRTASDAPIERRNDHTVSDFYREQKLMMRHQTGTQREIQLLKEAAYRAAEYYVEMFDRDLDWLRDHCRSQQKTIEEWLDNNFSPLNWIGENYVDLINIVRKGVSMRDWLSSRGTIIVSSMLRERGERKPRAIPPTPAEELDAETQVKQLRAITEALRGELRDLQRENAELKHECAVLRKAVEATERTVARAKSALDESK